MIKLELEINEVNTILRVLGQHPFSEVVALISKVKGQGDAQVSQTPPIPQPEPVVESTAEKQLLLEDEAQS